MDCVITTGELLQLLETQGADLAALPEQPYDSVAGGAVPADVLLHHGGGGSVCACMCVYVCVLGEGGGEGKKERGKGRTCKFIMYENDISFFRPAKFVS